MANKKKAPDTYVVPEEILALGDTILPILRERLSTAEHKITLHQKRLQEFTAEAEKISEAIRYLDLNSNSQLEIS